MADPQDLGSPISIKRQGGFYENSILLYKEVGGGCDFFSVMGGQLAY
jgi:hypothetical protein